MLLRLQGSLQVKIKILLNKITVVQYQDMATQPETSLPGSWCQLAWAWKEENVMYAVCGSLLR